VKDPKKLPDAGQAAGSAAVSDPRWTATDETGWGAKVVAELEERYPTTGQLRLAALYSSVHDVAQVEEAGKKKFALKLYRPEVRSLDEVLWEVGLQQHLFDAGVPTMKVIEGATGPVERLEVDGVERLAVLSEWAPGSKPRPSAHTYRLLGRLAAAIHAASDSYAPEWHKLAATLESEVWRHLERLRPLLEHADRYEEAYRLAEALEHYVTAERLEQGICHVDLTLDNVHLEGDDIYVFDFDSAHQHWRAWEPQGVFHYGVLSGGPWWDHWLEGYSSVRPLSSIDRQAVPWFVLMFQFENTAWKLGLTPTSVATTTVEAPDLARVVDSWTEWWEHHCVAARQ
jgi:Ser/Thr protein kinase RdoA (MazF antagonist)